MDITDLESLKVQVYILFHIHVYIYILSFIFLEPMNCIAYSEGPGFFEISRERDIIMP